MLPPCNTSAILISTGFDHANNTVYNATEPSTTADPYWVIVQDGDNSTSEPRPAYIVQPIITPGNPTYSWVTPTSTSNWINWYPTNSYYMDNGDDCVPAQSQEIIFERKFCINEDADLSQITMTLQVAADNCATFKLNGNTIGSTALAWTGSSSPSPFNQYHNITVTSGFVHGTNTLRISLVNWGGPMAAIVDGSVAGPENAFINAGCCQKNIFVTGGKKYLDMNGNGTCDASESGLPNWGINLKNSSGVIIASATTDVNGYYNFSNIPTSPSTPNNTSLLVPGTYYLEEVNQSGFFQTEPVSSSHVITITNYNTAVYGLNFGNSLCPNLNIAANPSPFCIDQPVLFSVIGAPAISLTNGDFSWDFGDGNTASGISPSHVYDATGNYVVSFTANIAASCIITKTLSITVTSSCCPSCLPSFRPIPNKKYILSAWVSEETTVGKETFIDPEVYLKFTIPGGTITFGPYTAKGNIIDGWQRIDQEFVVPSAATEIKIELASRSGSNSGPAYFDDVRLHPFDAGFKSYVYDPVSLKFVAELDNNNYATFYEYDEEGKLVRVKKETEKKTVTIKESRNSSVKRP